MRLNRNTSLRDGNGCQHHIDTRAMTKTRL
jgi:hypothetical protein